MTRTFYTFCLLLITLLGFSQNATIRGFVYNKSNGEPVAFSNVFLKGTTTGASTDLNGYFSLNKVTPGSYTLLVTNLEFDTISEKITIKAGEILSKKFFAEKGGIVLNSVDVSADMVDKIETPNVGIQKIDPVAINKLPSVGEPDLAQYLQVLPGVVFTGDQGGQLYIRGGSPIQNKVLLDGMVIYNPFHSIGLFSVFETDIIRSVDVFTNKPETNVLNIRFFAPKAGDVNITVLDLQGNVKAKEAAKNFEGEYVGQIKLGKGAKGTYFVIVSQGEDGISRKVKID